MNTEQLILDYFDELLEDYVPNEPTEQDFELAAIFIEYFIDNYNTNLISESYDLNEDLYDEIISVSFNETIGQSLANVAYGLKSLSQKHTENKAKKAVDKAVQADRKYKQSTGIIKQYRKGKAQKAVQKASNLRLASTKSKSDLESKKSSLASKIDNSGIVQSLKNIPGKLKSKTQNLAQNIGKGKVSTKEPVTDIVRKKMPSFYGHGRKSSTKDYVKSTKVKDTQKQDTKQSIPNKFSSTDIKDVNDTKKHLKDKFGNIKGVLNHKDGKLTGMVLSHSDGKHSAYKVDKEGNYHELSSHDTKQDAVNAMRKHLGKSSVKSSETKQEPPKQFTPKKMSSFNYGSQSDKYSTDKLQHNINSAKPSSFNIKPLKPSETKTQEPEKSSSLSSKNITSDFGKGKEQTKQKRVGDFGKELRKSAGFESLPKSKAGRPKKVVDSEPKVQEPEAPKVDNIEQPTKKRSGRPKGSTNKKKLPPVVQEPTKVQEPVKIEPPKQELPKVEPKVSTTETKPEINSSSSVKVFNATDAEKSKYKKSEKDIVHRIAKDETGDIIAHHNISKDANGNDVHTIYHNGKSVVAKNEIDAALKLKNIVHNKEEPKNIESKPEQPNVEPKVEPKVEEPIKPSKVDKIKNIASNKTKKSTELPFDIEKNAEIPDQFPDATNVTHFKDKKSGKIIGSVVTSKHGESENYINTRHTAYIGNPEKGYTKHDTGKDHNDAAIKLMKHISNIKNKEI